ncbi:MAG TPA: hypothetical protein VEI97_15220 [bacterium]|nr:hypothetical protein [bacterium]
MKSTLTLLGLGLAALLAGCGGGDGTTIPDSDVPINLGPSFNPSTRLAAASAFGDLAYLEFRTDSALELGFSGGPPPVVDCFGRTGGEDGGTLVFQGCSTTKGPVTGSLTYTRTGPDTWKVNRDVTLSSTGAGIPMRLQGDAVWTRTNFNTGTGRVVYEREGTGVWLTQNGRITITSRLIWSRVDGKLLTRFPAGEATVTQVDLAGNTVRTAKINLNGTPIATITSSEGSFTYNLTSPAGRLIPIDNGPERVDLNPTPVIVS